MGADAHGKPHAAPEMDEHDETVRQLTRGVWIEFMQKDDQPRQLRLAWIGPQQRLYIFSTRERKQSLSISSTDLAKWLRKGLATIVELDDLVGRGAVGSRLTGAGAGLGRFRSALPADAAALPSALRCGAL